MAKTSKAMLVMAGIPIHASYEGGPYIDLSFEEGGEAFDVINVYDYAAGKPEIKNTAAAVREQLKEYRDAAGESLAHDLREHEISIGRRSPW